MVFDIRLVFFFFFGFVCSDKRNKSKNKQIGLPQTKNVLHNKGNHNKMKRQTTEWKKIFANGISNGVNIQAKFCRKKKHIVQYKEI